MGNIELEKKIPILKKSDLKINKVLINFINKKNNNWTEDLITERSNMLSSLAYDEIWKS
jgi:hypothetical protein